MNSSTPGPGNLSVKLLICCALLANCTSKVIVPDQDPTQPNVTIKQIVDPQSPTVQRVGTPGSRPLREVVSGRDRLGLLGHGEDSDGGVKSVSVQGQVTVRCEGISGTRDLAATNSNLPLSVTENRRAAPGDEADPVLNAILEIPLHDTIENLKTRCEPVFKITDATWVSGKFTAEASNFSNTTVQTHHYEFLWKPCVEGESHTTDLVATFQGSNVLRLHANNQWSTITVSRVDFLGKPTWSPCKDRVAFRASPRKSDGEPEFSAIARDLFIVSRDGTKQRVTDSGTCRTLKQEAGIPVSDDQDVKDICVFSDPDWSAAGEIAAAVQFFSGQGTPSRLFLVVIDPDGPEFKIVSQSHQGQATGVWNPKWSRYGDRIVFTTLTVPDISLAQGVFVTTPGFRSLCKIEIPGAVAWADDDGPGGSSRIAYETADGIGVAELTAPSSNTGCPTLANDALLPGSTSGDFSPVVFFNIGDFAFVRDFGNSKDVFSESGGGVTKHIDIRREVTGIDF